MQSGFPEPAQSAWLARYLERLPARLGAQHIGTAIRGGVEGIQAIPPLFRRKTLSAFEQLGADLAQTGAFPADRLNMIAGSARLSPGRRLLFRVVNAIGLGPDGYFGRQLKAAGAYHDRRARPYLPKPKPQP